MNREDELYHLESICMKEGGIDMSNKDQQIGWLLRTVAKLKEEKERRAK